MNWEGLKMKSETSLFNRSFSANLLKRCWPLWAAYLCICLMSLPGILYGVNPNNYIGDPSYNHFEYLVLTNGCQAVLVSFVVAIIVAMAMFSFLYNSRTCDMISALPMKRETVFFTAWATGLLPLIASDIFTVFVTFLLYGEYLSMRVLFTWLGLTVMGNVAFYGFAVFCAMLTGSLYILPLVYVVLSLTVYVAEGAVLALLSSLVYGFVYGQHMLSFLSPVAELYENLKYTNLAEVTFQNDVLMMDGGQYHLQGLPTLIFAFAAGILFSFFALLLYRKRRMETAGDTVSIPILKPIFKYCMAGGSALVLGCFITHEFLEERLSGIPLAAGAFIFMAIGAGIGYFVAEMLIQKTMKVLPGGWKGARGLFLCCAACAVFVCCCEADVFGYSRKVPPVEEIESVYIGVGGDITLRETDNIAAATALHRSIIEARKTNSSAALKRYMNLTYDLKDGSQFHRLYYLAADEAQIADEYSNLREAYTLINTREARLSRLERGLRGIEVKPEAVSSANVSVSVQRESDYNYDTLRLTPAQFTSLYYDAVLPDVSDGLLGLAELWEEVSPAIREGSLPEPTGPGGQLRVGEAKITVNIFADLNEKQFRFDKPYDQYGYISLNVTAEDCRTSRWLKEHTNIQSMMDELMTEQKE